MRRRSFLLTAFGAAAGAGLLPVSGCAAGRRTPRPLTFLHASLPTPPHPSAAPTAFGEEAVWPLRIKEPHHRPLPDNAAIETVHGTLLLGKVHNDSSDPLSGDSPIIVDLTGPTTYAVVPDSSEHGYRIEEMTPPYRENRLPPSPGTPITDQLAGASASDDEFAYVITGSEDMRAGQSPEGRGRLSLLKIRLSDRTIVASTILGENLDLSLEMAHHFSIVLTPDGGSLLVTSSFPPRALRLSTADLSVQLDLASITSQRFSAVDGGEAVALNTDDGRTQTAVVTLADGVAHALETMFAQLVHQGYLYATRRAEGDQPFSELIINLATGERLEPEDLPGNDEKSKQATLSAHEGFIIRETDYVQVRRNGSATALLTWKPSGQEASKGVAICGSVLYVALGGGRMRLVNLDTGEVIQESKTGNQYDYGELVAVTPYGACYKNNFYPATAWQG
ncbi:hypothetical protein [uncultured Actinomyces sp.]|uniref:hypothetical protein n=1 Tax=uncultured Actinomyces sp. TaxID=249061 RepID=UPI0028D405D9|nr:hypothetical protein [uncultured Actinomyces sp.]